MTLKKNAPSVSTLFQHAKEDGTLSCESQNVLTVVDLGAQIQEAMGIRVDDVPSSEVVLVTLMPDDSSSIQSSGNAAAIRDGHNLVLDALLTSKQKDHLLVHTRYLNGSVLYPYCPLEQAVRMDASNYRPDKGTPLYDQAVVLLGTVFAKSQEFLDNGVQVRTVTLILTDGCDVHSSRADARKVASLVGDLHRAEGHIVAAMGVDDGQTDFRKVFREMGIEDPWILTPRNNASEIRKAFSVFSQSALQVIRGVPGVC